MDLLTNENPDSTGANRINREFFLCVLGDLLFKSAYPMKLNNLLVIVLAAGILSACGKKTADAPPAVAPAAVVNATNQPAPATTPNPAFEKLKGAWQRPDGGYIVEIRSVEPGGKMDAAYFNPRPINVAKAEALQDGAATKVFIELRDVNYPGSTYTLTYDPASDQLVGIYYQAAIQQRFDVVFVRMK
jgi:hypothetical protein